MDHVDHVALLRQGVPAAPGAVWADIGAGWGAFTLALADLLGPDSTIHAVDRDAGALRRLERTLPARFPAVALHTHQADFTRPLDLPPLDGLVMANALHFVRDKAPVLALLRDCLRPGGRVIVVEYNTARGNRWVPYPFTYAGWESLAAAAGLVQTRLLHRHPSSFLHEFYAALSLAPADYDL